MVILPAVVRDNPLYDTNPRPDATVAVPCTDPALAVAVTETPFAVVWLPYAS